MASTLCLGHPAQASTFNYLATPGVIIQYVATGSSEPYGIRENGSSDTWMSAENTAYVDTIGFLMTGVDSGRVLEVYEGDTAIKTYLIGYTMEGVTFFTNAIDKSLSTPGSYQDVDISADASGSAIWAIHALKVFSRT